MRDLIIKYFALSYNVKLFGITFTYLRAVLPTTFFFCLAGLYTMLQEYQSIWDFRTLDFLLWLPVLICFWFGFNWFGLGYFRQFPIRYADLKDWEQKLQYLNAPSLISKEEVKVSPGTQQKLNQQYHEKYHTDEEFVNGLIGLLPFAFLLLTGLAYLIVK